MEVKSQKMYFARNVPHFKRFSTLALLLYKAFPQSIPVAPLSSFAKVRWERILAGHAKLSRLHRMQPYTVGQQLAWLGFFSAAAQKIKLERGRKKSMKSILIRMSWIVCLCFSGFLMIFKGYKLTLLLYARFSGVLHASSIRSLCLLLHAGKFL